MYDINIQNISKTYTSIASKHVVKAVDNVSLQIQKGELFGLIGPDGAGKTTIFRMLTTLLLPDTGSATVVGYDIKKDYKKIRNIVGYMPGKFSLYQDLSVEENLKFFATIFNTRIEDNYDLIKDIYEQLAPFKDRKAGKLSGGMKQKLALCCALIHKPEVLFLDEPTTGVDVVSRREFWDMLGKLKSQGITILVSTPYMDEASLCERIALIQNGQIFTVDTPAKIIENYGEKLYAVKASNMIALLRDSRIYQGLSSCHSFGDFTHITFKEDNEKEHNAYLNYLKMQEHENIVFKEIKPTIEDCFIKISTTKPNSLSQKK